MQSTRMESKPFFLSPIDNSVPSVYAPTLLLFPIPHTDSAIQSFIHGLESIFQAIPLLAGTIKAIPDGTIQVGSLAITSPWRTVDEILKIKDINKYSYSQLRKNNFPPTSFPLWDFIQIGFLSDTPVMHVQITLIEGGVVLASCIHHNFIDGTGTAAILELWAASCRGEIILNDRISSLWQRVPLLERDEKVAVEEFPEYRYSEKTHFLKRRSMGNGDQGGWLSRWWLGKKLKTILMKVFIIAFTKYQSLSYSTRLIYFPYADLARLKESLQATGDQETWISTMDTLSALIFCCVAQSRHEARHTSSTYNSTLLTKLNLWHRNVRSQSPFRSETLAQVMTLVNVRKHCQLPPNYIRNMFLPCMIQSPLHELVPSTLNLATQARKLRARLQGFDSVHVGRVASMIRSVPDVSKIDFPTYSTGDDHSQDLTITSWREQGCCAFDWGLHVGARCERVRTCNLFHDGLAIVFPEYSGSKIDGGIEMSLALRKDSMRELERNEFFNQVARWR